LVSAFREKVEMNCVVYSFSFSLSWASERYFGRQRMNDYLVEFEIVFHKHYFGGRPPDEESL